MRKPISTVAVLIWSAAISGALAADNPPSDASIKQLLEVVEMRKLPEAMAAQLDGAMKQAIQEATQGEQVPANIQQDIDKRQAQMIVAMKETLDWNKLEPVYVHVYQKSLTQQEVDGLIAFYKTPSGQAVLKKMPVIMQNAVNETQQLMQPLVQQLRTMQQDVRAKVQAEKDKKGG